MGAHWDASRKAQSIARRPSVAPLRSCASGCIVAARMLASASVVSFLRARMHRRQASLNGRPSSLSLTRGDAPTTWHVASTRQQPLPCARGDRPDPEHRAIRRLVVSPCASGCTRSHHHRRRRGASSLSCAWGCARDRRPCEQLPAGLSPTCRDAPMLQRRSSDRDDPSQTRWDAPDWEQAAILTEVSLHCAQWMPRDARRQLATPVSPRCAQGCAVLTGRECRSDDVFPICAGMLRSSPSCRP